MAQLTNQQDLHESKEGVIEAASIRVVAVRGSAFNPLRPRSGDWSCYYMTHTEIDEWWYHSKEVVQLLKQKFPESSVTLSDTWEADLPNWESQLDLVNNHIASRGTKVPEIFGKYTLFTLIMGPYRD